MKKSDIAMIVFIASVSTVLAYFIASAIPAFSTASQSAKVKTIEPIDATIIEPSADIFNKDAINPAVEVQINGTVTDTTQVQTGTSSDTQTQSGIE
jgi:hypothetical protein